MLSGNGKLLRVFVGETDRREGVPLYEWLVRKAQEHGLAGATVLRGMEGFGAHSQMHTAKILRLAQELPIVVEIVDSPEKIADFLSVVDGAVEEGLATVEDVTVHFYRKRGSERTPGDGAAQGS